jgi:type VI secretion system protein ImpC
MAEETGEKTLLEKIIWDGKMVRDESQVDYAKDLVGELAKQVLDQTMTVSADTAAMINSRIAEIDELISKQLDEFMHAPDFQKLEAPGAACATWSRTPKPPPASSCGC